MSHRRHVPPSAPPTPGCGAGRGGAGGFTMIELITIMVIMGIVSAVIVSSINLTDSSSLSQADALRSHIRYAQTRALKSGNDWGIRCQGGSYWLFEGDNPTVDITPLPGESADTITLSDKKVTVTSFTVVFDRFGIPRNTAGARLTDTTITVASSNDATETRTVIITQETGYVQ